MFAHPLCLAVLAAFVLSGCDKIPGKPDPSHRWQPPESNLDFDALYQANCRACHSDGHGLAASINLSDPNYVAFVDPAMLRKVTAEGVVGTSMPGFSHVQGGPLTDAQLKVMQEGILAWGSGGPRPADLPPYQAQGPGNPEAGKVVFQAACASCHGPDGSGVAGKGASIVDPAYLHLVSDQYLRTVIVVGRPEIGHPGFRDLPVGRILTDAEVNDLVAWLAARRTPDVGSLPPPNPDQP